MAKNWDTYSRQAIDLATSASCIGFSAAKTGTRLGFSVARSITSATVGLTTAAVDHAIFGGSTVTRPMFEAAATTVLTVAERITLAPIHLSEYITSTSLLAAHSSINVLSGIFPGSSDASFSLVSVIALVWREWTYPGPDAKNTNTPERQYGVTQLARALVAWVALQGATQEWQEKKWLKHLREIDVIDPRLAPRIKRQASRIRVTSDIIFPGHQGPQIIAADIGDPDATKHHPFMSRTKSHISLVRSRASSNAPLPIPMTPPPLPNDELKTTMRRLSKMVLAGYGGATLLFFGLSPESFGKAASASASKAKIPVDILTSSDSIAREKTEEEARLTSAVDAAEAEAANDGDEPAGPSYKGEKEYSWWDLLLGKHDQEIFERSTAHPEDPKLEKAAKKKANIAAMKATAVVGDVHMMPRFWVITDHGRGQIVLVIRGTMSLNEIAVDLTCDPEDFEPASTPAVSDISETPLPGEFESPSFGEQENMTRSSSSSRPKYQVHGGMLKLARAMGDIGKPVQVAVKRALYNNPDFGWVALDLLLCGHSLGAGVAGILGMMWADPTTCLTVRSSGLPVGRSVQVFAFGPPTLTDAPLARLTNKLIVSLVYSHDIVSRLSVGTVRDLKSAALWLCEAEEKGGVEGWSAVTARAKKCQAGEGTADDLNWLIAIRKTLEANMQQTYMFPPGRVLWAVRDADLHPAHRLHHISSYGGHGTPEAQKDTSEKLRVFEVLDAEQVFSQMVFARDMLTAHLAHRYDRAIHDLL